MASSQFLTNKQQGDWAEQVVFDAINANSADYLAVKYGRADDVAAGDPGFPEFYANYTNELNEIGKRPDLLIFKHSDIAGDAGAALSIDDRIVERALAAIEVRSSSFLAQKYAAFMDNRIATATAECIRIKSELMREPLSGLLEKKSPEHYRLIRTASPDTFRALGFRSRSWLSSAELGRLSELLKRMKDQIRVLHRRDYLSITPKLEDIVFVNRWIQRFGVRHFYLQVFFDKAYVIPFEEILAIASDSEKEGAVFSVERDVKNQGKTTIKVNVAVGKELLGRIDMPRHTSAMKELDRGRLLFYVTFHGGRGYLDSDVFYRDIIDNE